MTISIEKQELFSDDAPENSTPTILRFRLQVKNGRKLGHSLYLDSRSMYKIGRGEAVRVDLSIPDPNVSDLHAYILQRIDGGYALRNNTSPQKTLLNGHPVLQEAQPLTLGDIITVGVTELVFEQVPE